MEKKLEYFLRKVFKKTTSECGDEIVKYIKKRVKKQNFYLHLIQIAY